MATLADVAATYEKDARRSWSYAARTRTRGTADFLRRVVANRSAVDPNEHRIEWANPPDVSVRWVRQHGYRAVMGLGAGAGCGLTIQRGEETPLVAAVGDMLLWDGQRITIV